MDGKLCNMNGAFMCCSSLLCALFVMGCNSQTRNTPGEERRKKRETLNKHCLVCVCMKMRRIRVAVDEIIKLDRTTN